MANELSKSFTRIRQEMNRVQDSMDNHLATIDELSGEVTFWEDEIEELQSELEDLEQQALESLTPLEVYFDELVMGLCSYQYGIERDPWMIKERWGIEDTGFVVITESGNAYKCPDFCPTKDSKMTLIMGGRLK